MPSGRAFVGKTYVITGASSGFGRGVALAVGFQGANVVLAARRAELLNEVAARVRAAGGAPLVVPTDVAEPEDVARLARAAVARFGRIDVWINDAGVGVIGRFWEAPVEDYSRLIDVNLKGVVYGSYAAIRQFRVQGAGTLVNIGSVESEVPLAYQATYAATKAGVLSLGRALTQELRLAGLGRTIKVATIMPWASDTPFGPHAANYTGRTSRLPAMDDPQKVVEAIVRTSVHPRVAVPVGWKAQAAVISHRVAPGLTEASSANVEHQQQMERGQPAPASPGALYQPMPSGQTVRGGVRERMRQDDEERREAAGGR